MGLFTKLTQTEPIPQQNHQQDEINRRLASRIEDLELRFSQLNVFVTDEMERSRDLRLRASNDQVGAKRREKHARQIEQAVPSRLEQLQAAHPGMDGF